MSREVDKRPPPPDMLVDALQDRIVPSSGRLLGSVAIKDDLTEPAWPSDEVATVFLDTFEVAGAGTKILGAFRAADEARACCERAEARLDKDGYPGSYGYSMVSFDIDKIVLGEDTDLTGHPHFKDRR